MVAATWSGTSRSSHGYRDNVDPVFDDFLFGSGFGRPNKEAQGLVDFMMPAIEPHLARPVDVIVGDAYVVIPQMRADVALIDIYPKYGRNKYMCNKLKASSPGIRKFWCWGALT